MFLKNVRQIMYLYQDLQKNKDYRRNIEDHYFVWF